MKTASPNNSPATGTSRRNFLKTSALAATYGGLAAVPATTKAVPATAQVDPAYRIEKGRIRQSIMGWCFKPMPEKELAKHCKEIGLVAMEGISIESYPMVKELGLKVSLVGSHGFAKGPISPANHHEVKKILLDRIDLAASIGAPNVITFTGMREAVINDDQGAKNCINCWLEVIKHAEKKKITLVLEHLNSRDNSHPMKGHPGYFGDNVDFCIQLVKAVGSPNFKLLFDIYHVQIMNGDVIRRIKMYKDYIGHYHTAGCPGRGELDDNQEINYPPILRAILETGYTGYVAQEFIPTWDDPILALRHAAKVCDV
ncbi:MAG: hyi 2 [Verrucomicrobia bacterium]|jgi:hydroxypyruvate isomerase|nr:hyi 2 [Verrucomicrobiota bacterium]